VSRRRKKVFLGKGDADKKKSGEKLRKREKNAEQNHLTESKAEKKAAEERVKAGPSDLKLLEERLLDVFETDNLARPEKLGGLRVAQGKRFLTEQKKGESEIRLRTRWPRVTGRKGIQNTKEGEDYGNAVRLEQSKKASEECCTRATKGDLRMKSLRLQKEKPQGKGVR